MSRYKVVGNHKIDGVPPGRTVKIDDPVKARGLIKAGHLAELPKPTEEVTGDGRVQS